MRGASQLVDFIHHLRCAYEYMQGFRRDKPGSNAQRLGAKYAAKIEWMYKDLVTNPAFPIEVREGLKSEWNVDTFATDAIREKLALLRDDQRLEIERLIELVLDGQEITSITTDVAPNGATDATVGNVDQ
ncbi:MAG: hypothetical protein EBR82_78000 [Caulobacteraceae bacterium]|nr:hypothetical protein [Caulobacteraceae bacterium]